jgi:hypothetical protein
MGNPIYGLLRKNVKKEGEVPCPNSRYPSDV